MPKKTASEKQKLPATEKQKPPAKPKKQPKPKAVEGKIVEPESIERLETQEETVDAISKELPKKIKKQPQAQAVEGEVVASESIEESEPVQKNAVVATKKEFIPVITNEIKTEYPIGSIKHYSIVNPIQVDSKYHEYVALYRKKGKENEESIIYVEPAAFEKYALAPKYIPANADEIRKDVLQSLQKFKQAWVQLGTAILAVNKSRIYRAWGYNNFKDYCEQELKLHQSTVHELIDSTMFLSQKDPELYKKLIGDRGQEVKKIPSYHSLYLLSKKQDQLEKQELFADLYSQVMAGEISSGNLQKKLRELLGSKETIPTPEWIAKNYENWYELLKKANLSEDVIHKAEELLNLLKEAK